MRKYWVIISLVALTCAAGTVALGQTEWQVFPQPVLTSDDGVTLTAYSGNPVVHCTANPTVFPFQRVGGPSVLGDGTQFQMRFVSMEGNTPGIGYAISGPGIEPTPLPVFRTLTSLDQVIIVTDNDLSSTPEQKAADMLHDEILARTGASVSVIDHSAFVPDPNVTAFLVGCAGRHALIDALRPGLSLSSEKFHLETMTGAGNPYVICAGGGGRRPT